MNLIDTHSHLYGPEFDEDREEALARAAGASVGRLLLPAIDSESHDRLFDLCRLHPQRCVPMIGLHPTSVNDNPRWQEELELVEQLLAAPPEGIPPFCAIGEIGLDFYWSRDFRFGIGGVVTFKKSLLAAIVPEMELDDLVLETDCPYLTPAPHRGERNESAYVRFVCNEVARLKGLTPDEVADATTASAERLFRLNGSSSGQDGTKPRPAPAQGSETDNQPHIQP